MGLVSSLNSSVSLVKERFHRGENPQYVAFPDNYEWTRRVREYDRTLELGVDNRAKLYALYRVLVCGASPSSDVLQKVLVLDKPPGEWLIGWLAERDITKGGIISPEAGTRIFMKNIEDENIRLAESRWAFIEERSHDAAKYVYGKARGRMMGSLVAHGKKNKYISLRSGKEVPKPTWVP